MARLTEIHINRGTTYGFQYQYQRDGANATLVGATVRFTMKPVEWDNDTDDSEALITKDVTDGNSDGEATITIEPADTALLDKGTYYFDIKVQNSDGTIYKTNEGLILLDASPTNRRS